MSLRELIEDIHALNEKLKEFEQKYGVMSETFYKWYTSGEEPEDPEWVSDFSLWAGFYKIKLDREEEYRQLTFSTKEN